MIIQMNQVEIEMERLARRKRLVIHRAPCSVTYENRIGYFVCDYNDTVVYPAYQAGNPGGATAAETCNWLRPK